MKPSSDIALFTTTLPFPVLVSLILFLTATAYADAVRTGGSGLPLYRPSGTFGEAAALRTIQHGQPAKDARAVRNGVLSNQSGERPARRRGCRVKGVVRAG
jgi:hypothetical protein